MAGLETGELNAVEDVPTKSVDRLKANKDVKLLPLLNWWIQISVANASAPPATASTAASSPECCQDSETVCIAPLCRVGPGGGLRPYFE